MGWTGLWRKGSLWVLPAAAAMAAPPATFAASSGEMLKQTVQAGNTVWVVVAAVLVMFMQAGFALLEAGMTRMKNVGHVAAKNILVFAIASLVFWAVGFAIAFGPGNGVLGTSGWFLGGRFLGDGSGARLFPSLSFSDVPIGAKYLFEVVFAAVSLAIVWGGMAERTKLIVYLIFGAVFTSVIYPVVGHWIWGGGWLSRLGMQDFAGSTVVHLQGAVASTIGAILLGPRIGKFNKNGSPNAIPGHNMAFAVVGVIILWFGWFGFNPGSTLMSQGSFFAYVAMNTNLAAAAGALGGLFAAWAMLGKPDISMMLNGVLAALVAITAACAFVDPWAAAVIGAVAGGAMPASVMFFERVLHIDDVLGAASTHGVAGIWGTLATGLFATPALVRETGVGTAGLFYGGGWHQLLVQAEGIGSVFVFVSIASTLTFLLLRQTVGLRVSPAEEMDGLDISEHGMWGYPEHFMPVPAGYYHRAEEGNLAASEEGPVGENRITAI